jgi:hypothetical protein
VRNADFDVTADPPPPFARVWIVLLWILSLAVAGACCWWLAQHIKSIPFPDQVQKVKQR